LRIPSDAIRQGTIIPIENGVDPALATIAEPLACVMRGQAVLHIKPGETVLVIGAGPVGVLHMLLAKLQGAGQVIMSEGKPDRLRQAADLGADLAVNPFDQDLARAVAERTMGTGADVVIVAAPAHAAQEQALQLATIGGRVSFFGGLPQDRPSVQFNSNLVHYKELTVTATTACSTGDCWRAVAVINSHRLDLTPLVGARYPLSSAREAFETVESASTLKVVMQP
jgi:L-iditol 2-dehydrogenase